MRYFNPFSLIVCLIAAFLGIGIVMVYSSDAGRIIATDNNYATLLRHVLWVLFGTIAMVVLMYIDYHIIQKYSWHIMGLSFLCLALVLIPGVGSMVNGARRWIRIGTIGFQPSEFAKIAAIIFISNYIVKNQQAMKEFIKGFVIPMGVVGILSIFILIEPDFGTATFLSLLAVTMLIVGGARIVYIVFCVLTFVPIVYELIWEVPYRKERFVGFLDPWVDPLGKGYHIIQSWIALGSGGISGVGLGKSYQKLFFLPESSNDFIFSIIGEELGLIGTIAIIALFSLFIWQGIRVCYHAPDLFGSLLAFGVTYLIGLQAVINIGVVVGCLPTKGIPLPFISAGGSSLFFTLLGIGILLNVARQTRQPDSEVPRSEYGIPYPVLR
ncbi:MAG TPA: putative lipid II flippase FtsW [Candidatus Brocadiia bacterium]|nr:putative lipid II flippase FtsW [Planctomycetota bacterium]MDO8092306.1 putative lipid II flippase FtsW [Candidatus Brocadiales bacterium]